MKKFIVVATMIALCLLHTVRVELVAKEPAKTAATPAPKPRPSVSPHVPGPAGNYTPTVKSNHTASASQQVSIAFYIIGFVADAESAQDVLHKVFPEMKKMGNLAIVGPNMTAKNIGILLREYGQVSVLHAPRITTRSGQKAALHAKSEITTLTENDETFVFEFKWLGTQLDCTPRVLDDGRLRLAMAAELAPPVPAKGESHATPPTGTRRFSTTVEMKSGQSLVTAMTNEQPLIKFEDPQKESAAHKRCRLIITRAEVVKAPVKAAQLDEDLLMRGGWPTASF